MMKSNIEKMLDSDRTNLDNYIYRAIYNEGTSDDNLGMVYKDIIIIKKFYQYLNIDCLFIYDINDKFYAIEDELQKEEYDIIFISKMSKFSRKGIDKYIEIDPRIHKFNISVDKLKIKYNNDDYDIDYIMNTSDKITNCADCGHCISAIHYNGNEYYYDSQYTKDNFECSGNVLMDLPCSLIEKKWTTTLPDKTNNFCTVPCSHINNYIKTEMLDKSEITSKYSDTFCYNNRNSRIEYCYVRNVPVRGGEKGNNKNLTRKVYLDKNLNKYYINYNNNKIYLFKKP